MVISYSEKNKLKPEIITADNQILLQEAVWIDLLNPSEEEKKMVGQVLTISIPTQKEMQEIEFSSRFYQENEAIFMTSTMVAKSDSPQPKSGAVTLILLNNKLITVRYIEPQSFALFISRLAKFPPKKIDAVHLFIDLLDASIDRLADILENISSRLNEHSQNIFHPYSASESTVKVEYKNLLEAIGSAGDLNTKVQESLITFNWLITFFEQNALSTLESETQMRLTLLSQDIKSLSKHLDFIATKVNFLLDATLGMINIEQNNIIKIFSIVAVILLPPTLVASIYGMNFQIMPELSWQWGYPIALILMIFSAWLPFKIFKKKKWL